MEDDDEVVEEEEDEVVEEEGDRVKDKLGRVGVNRSTKLAHTATESAGSPLKPPLPALVSGAVGGDVVRGFGVVFALGGTGLTVGGVGKVALASSSR